MYLAVLVRYLMYWYRFECTPGNGGKYMIRMLLLPFILFLALALISALGKATDLAENLQWVLMVPGAVGVICLVLIERHKWK